MAKKTDVKKNISTSSSNNIEDGVDFDLQSKSTQQLNFNNDQANGIKNRIINRRLVESTEDERKFLNAVENSVKSGVEKGMAKPVADLKSPATNNFNRSAVESTADLSPSNNNASDDTDKEYTKLSSKLDSLAQAEEASKKSIHEQVTGVVKAIDNFGGRKWENKSSYALTLGAEAISPVLGQAVQLAITTGLGKSLWNMFAPNKTADKAEKRHQEIKETLKKLDKLDGIKETTAQLLAVNKEGDTKKIDKEVKAEVKAKEESEELKTSTKRLFHLQEKSAEQLSKIAKSHSGISRFLKGFSLVNVLEFIFNDKFRAMFMGYMRNLFKGILGPGEIIAGITATVTGLTTLATAISPAIKMFKLLSKIGMTSLKLGFGGSLAAWKGLRTGWRTATVAVKGLASGLGSLTDGVTGIGSKLGNLIKSTGKLGAKAVGLSSVLGKAFTAFEVVHKGMNAFSAFKDGNMSKGVEETLKGVAYATLGPIGGLMAEAASGVGKYLGEQAAKIFTGFKSWFGVDKEEKSKETAEQKYNIAKQLNSIVDKDGYSVFDQNEIVDAMEKINSGKATLEDYMRKGRERLPKQVVAVEVVPEVKQVSVKAPAPVKKKTIAVETIKNTGNLKTTDNINTAEMEAQKNAKIVVIEKKVPQQQPASQPIVNTIPSNSAMRPSLG